MKTLCFDIGGTYIKHGLIDYHGKLYSHGKFPTPKKTAATASQRY